MVVFSTPPPDGLLPSGHEWDFSKTGIIWLDWAIDIAVVALVFAGIVLAAYLRWLHPHIKKLREDAAAIRRQTENSHSGAPHPNLRDNLDANQAEARAAFQALMQASDQLREALAQQAKDIGGIRAEIRGDREAFRWLEEKVDRHIQEHRPGPGPRP